MSVSPALLTVALRGGGLAGEPRVTASSHPTGAVDKSGCNSEGYGSWRNLQCRGGKQLRKPESCWCAGTPIPTSATCTQPAYPYSPPDSKLQFFVALKGEQLLEQEGLKANSTGDSRLKTGRYSRTMLQFSSRQPKLAHF